MNTLAKIACRTVGVAGMGLALYDASRVSEFFAQGGKKGAQARYLEKAYFNSRTSDKVSYSASAIGEKTFDLRTRNPLPGIWGKIRGRTQGFLYGLGNQLPLIGCSALALTCKNWLAKAGAIGVLAGVVYKVAREGFGLGKPNPMD